MQRSFDVDPLNYHGRMRVRTGREMLCTYRDIARHQHELRFPLLLLHGTEDELIDPAGMEAFFHAVSSPDKKLRGFPGMWHDLLHEPGHQEVLTMISEWIANRSQTTAGESRPDRAES